MPGPECRYGRLARGLVQPAGLALAAVGRGDGAHGLAVVLGLGQAVRAAMVALRRQTPSGMQTRPYSRLGVSDSISGRVPF